MNRTFTALATFNLMSFLRRGIFYMFFYLYLRTFLGLSNTLASSLGTFNFLMSMLGQFLVWGPWLDRGPNLAPKMVVVGEIIAALTYLVAYQAHAFFLNIDERFIAALVIIGVLGVLEFFWGMSDLSFRSLVAKGTEGQSRGRMTGLIDGFGSVGQLIGLLSAGLLYNDGYGFAEGSIFYLVVVLILGGAFVILLVLPVKRLYPSSEETERSPPSGVPTLQISTSWKKLLRDYPDYRRYMLAFVVSVLALFSSAQILLYYLEDSGGVGLSSQVLSLVLVVGTKMNQSSCCSLCS